MFKKKKWPLSPKVFAKERVYGAIRQPDKGPGRAV